MSAHPLLIGGIAFVCVFGGALLGMALRRALPGHHVSTESKEVVRLGMGLVGTMAALALGLLLASAKSAYDARSEELRQLAANALLLDRALAHYGPEAQEARDLLRAAIARMRERLWAGDDTRRVLPVPARGEADFYDAIDKLAPQTPAQRILQPQLLRISIELGRLRLIFFEEEARPMPMPFVVVLVFWLTIIFASFGLFGPANATVITTLFVCALSVSGALYLILELTHPFEGLLSIADTPLRDALRNLGP